MPTEPPTSADPEARADPPALVFAALGGDAAAIGRELGVCGLSARLCGDAAALEAALADPSAALFAVATEEAAGRDTGAALARALAEEPVWARLPVVFLLGDVARPPAACRALREAGGAERAILLQRPARPATLRSVFRAQAEARRRQFETRDLLDALRRAEARQGFLLDELRHRTGNSLAVLQSVFSILARRSDSVAELTQAFSDRLHALVDAHAALARKHGGSRDLDGLVRDHVRPYCLSEDQLTASGPAARVTEAAGFDLALAVHELATNAAKHGALSAERGRVTVRWTPDGAGGLDFVWTERGLGALRAPQRRGLGIRLLESFAAGGETAELRFEEAGLVWAARLPAGTVEL